MNDIPIDNENVWNFPSDFTGSITSSSERTGNTVYDSVTDTIYVYNRYQLELMKGESSDSEPVMSEDYIAEKVGMGQVLHWKMVPILLTAKHIIMCLLLHLQQKHRSFLQIRLGQRRQLRILLAHIRPTMKEEIISVRW